MPEPVIVGREKELEELQRHLDSAIAGRGNTVLVSAEAGMGKTRLVSEFLNSVRQKKIIQLSGWCLFNAGVPYFPFIEAFSNYYSTLKGASEKEELELTSWLKEPAKNELSVDLQYISPQTLKDQTFGAVAKALHSMAGENTVVLLIEDIHRADSASLSLLNYVARVVNDSEKILVLATFRTEELTNSSEGYPHQLVQTLAMMRREELFTQINLPSLTPTNVGRIAESMLADKVHEGLINKLAVESEGNPLFVVESLRLLHERKMIVIEKNEWRLAANELGIPPKIKDIIVQRLASLNYPQRRIVDAASVIGEEFDVGLLSAVTGQDSLEVLETLNVIAHSTSLVFADENRYRFDHARSKEIIYEALSEPLKHGYHQRIAETLENRRNVTLPLGDLAYHYAQAGNKEKAIKYSIAAAKNELEKWSYAEAIKHFSFVLRSIADENGFLNLREIAMEGLGDAFHANNMFAESITTFKDLARLTKSDFTMLRALRKAMDSAWLLGDASLVMALSKKAEPLMGIDSLEKAKILEVRSNAFFIQQNPKAALEDFCLALKIFEEKYSLWNIAKSLMNGGATQVHSGMFEDGLTNCLRSIALFEELGDHRWQMTAFWVTAQSFNHCLLESEALDMYNKTFDLDQKDKTSHYRAVINAYAFYARFVLEFNGDFEKAIKYNLKALESAKKTDSLAMIGTIYSNLIIEYSLIGDVAHASEYFDKLIQLPHEILNHYYLQLNLTKAVYFSGKEMWEESNKYFKEWVEWAKSYPTPFRLSRINLLYSWALEKQGRVHEAMLLLKEREKIHQELRERFEHANIRAALVAPGKVTLNEKFEVRLDIVNVSRCNLKIISILDLLQPDLKYDWLPEGYLVENNLINLIDKGLQAFQIRTLKMKMKPKRTGEIILAPKIVYVNELGQTREILIKRVQISVETARVVTEREIEKLPLELGFKNEFSRRAFDFLIKAFMDDYVSNKLQSEGSGWRTLMEIVKDGHISKHTIYGRSGKGGKALEELKTLGLIELSYFTGERGRGGGGSLKLEPQFINRKLSNCLTN